MNDTSRDQTRAALLAGELHRRVRASAAELSAAAARLTASTPPEDGYTSAAAVLRPLLTALIDDCAIADIDAGPGAASVATALGVTEATVRRRYAHGPRELPLTVVLWPADPSD